LISTSQQQAVSRSDHCITADVQNID